jgi:hypothetical protein
VGPFERVLTGLEKSMFDANSPNKEYIPTCSLYLLSIADIFVSLDQLNFNNIIFNYI